MFRNNLKFKLQCIRFCLFRSKTNHLLDQMLDQIAYCRVTRSQGTVQRCEQHRSDRSGKFGNSQYEFHTHSSAKPLRSRNSLMLSVRASQPTRNIIHLHHLPDSKCCKLSLSLSLSLLLTNRTDQTSSLNPLCEPVRHQKHAALKFLKSKQCSQTFETMFTELTLVKTQFTGAKCVRSVTFQADVQFNIDLVIVRHHCSARTANLNIRNILHFSDYENARLLRTARIS